MHKVVLIQLQIPKNESLVHAKLSIPQPNKNKTNGCKNSLTTSPPNKTNSHNKTIVNKEELCNFNLNVTNESVEEDTTMYQKVHIYELQWTNKRCESIHDFGYSVTKIFAYSLKNSTTQTLFIDVTRTVSNWMINTSRTYGFYVKFEKDSGEEEEEKEEEANEDFDKKGDDHHDENKKPEKFTGQHKKCGDLRKNHLSNGVPFSSFEKEDRDHPRLFTFTEPKS